jgi:hypothetical protein
VVSSLSCRLARGRDAKVFLEQDAHMPLPNFIVIGVAKAATTSVHAYADQHSEIFMSPVKETNYFALYGKPPDSAGPGDNTIRNRQSVFRRPDYEALFEGRTTQRILGEASPSYMTVSEVPSRIAGDIPECRLVVGLRQPVDRAFAAWTWARMSGREKLPFEAAIRLGAEREAARWGWGNYLEQGYYADQLERYLELFPGNQLHSYLFEDFVGDPVGVMQGIFRYLDVDSSFVPDTSRMHNRSGIIRNRVLRRLWETSSGIRDRVRPSVPERLRHRAFDAVTSRSVRPQLDPALRARLTFAYRKDILRTQELIGRDLSHWLAGADDVDVTTA